MLRFLALLLLAVLVWMAVSALLSNLRGTARRRTAPPTTAPPGVRAPSGEPLVRCDRCGLRVPATRTLTGPPVPDGPVPGRFCSPACRDGARGAPPEEAPREARREAPRDDPSRTAPPS